LRPARIRTGGSRQKQAGTATTTPALHKRIPSHFVRNSALCTTDHPKNLRRRTELCIFTPTKTLDRTENEPTKHTEIALALFILLFEKFPKSIIKRRIIRVGPVYIQHGLPCLSFYEDGNPFEEPIREGRALFRLSRSTP
jgi:hypothetical protein